MIPEYAKKYPKMFEPLTIRRGRNEFVFNNRVMMSPVGICATGGGADNGRINIFGVDYWTGIITPPASTLTAYLYGEKEWLPGNCVMTYGILYSLINWVVVMVLGYGLGAILF